MLLFALALAAQPIVVDVVDDDVGCAGSVELAAVVNARAGEGSVVVDGTRVVEVHYFSREGVGAEVKLVVDGVARGARRLGPFAQCRSLQDALALTLALIVDPLAPVPIAPATVEPPAPPPPTPTSTTVVPEVPEVRVAVRERSDDDDDAPFRVQGWASAGVGSGWAPGFGLSGLLRLRLAVGSLGFGLGARMDAPAPLLVDGKRRLESGAAAGVVDGCYVRLVADVDVEACAVVEAGALRAVGIGFSQPDPTVAQVITTGVALGVTVPLLGGLGLSTRLGVSTPALGARLLDGDGDVIWASPPLVVQWVVGISAEPAAAAR